MRHNRIVAFATFVSLLLSSTTIAVAAESSSPHPPLLNQAGFIKTGSIDPVRSMHHTARQIQRDKELRWYMHWLHKQHRIAHKRAERKAQAAREAAASSSPGSLLQSIATCESGGDPKAVSVDGVYRGKYQFTLSTWHSVGGSGDPAAAPEPEQDARAEQLLATQGAAPWPICGRGL